VPKSSVLELAWPRQWFRASAAAAGAALFTMASGAVASPAGSEEPPPVLSSNGAPVLVWYRSSAGCPDGTAFVQLLNRLGRPVSLAGAGDRIDFVVNVAFAEPESSGRLERQSSERTIAIRDVIAASCQEVAEVLALSLDLALSPESEHVAPAPETSGWTFGIGAQGTFETGLARTLLPGGAGFVQGGSSPQALSVRLSLRGAWGERAALAAIDVQLLASRTEACWSWTFDDVVLGPCAGIDVGLVFAESPATNGRSDTGFWSSAVTHGRASWQIGRLALEAQIGLLLPFVRYRFGTQTGEELTGSAPLGLQTALGISFRL
jgi:hypothetical protein